MMEKPSPGTEKHTAVSAPKMVKLGTSGCSKWDPQSDSHPEVPTAFSTPRFPITCAQKTLAIKAIVASSLCDRGCAGLCLTHVDGGTGLGTRFSSGLGSIDRRGQKQPPLTWGLWARTPASPCRGSQLCTTERDVRFLALQGSKTPLGTK